MPEQTLAQRIKAKYPGTYDALPDAELEARVTKKYPGTYDHIPRSMARPEDFTPQAQQPEGSAVGRFFSNAGEMLNPVTMAKGIGQAVRHPIDTATSLYEGQMQQFDKAGARFAEGRYTEGFGHGLAGLVPLVGPAAAESGEQIASGDVAGGLGRGAGLLAPVVGTRPAVAAARAGVRAAPVLAGRVASRFEQGAQSRVADVMSPKVGRQKVRLGNKAEQIAPAMAKDLAKDGAPFTRDAFHAQVQTRYQAAKAGLDEASDARLSARSFQTQALIDDLLKKRAEFTAQADVGSRVPRTATTRQSQIVTESGTPFEVTDLKRAPIGADQVPAPWRARVAQIDEAIKELRTLGPTTTYEPIRRIRQAFDGPAEVVYNPATTADFLTARGSQLGAADVTGVLRSHLAQWDPATATANASFSLYKNADDLLKAVAEVERTRPRVGRQIMARLTGTLIGGQQGGAPGALAGYVGGPLVESALASGATTQLKTAALMQRMADAIRTGNMARVDTVTALLKRELQVTGAVQAQRTTSPNESQTGARPALATP
jgi:hypothetical protein